MVPKWVSTRDSGTYPMALTSLSIRAAPPEPSLLAFTKYGTKVGQHKRFWSLITLMSSDDSYEHKHLHSFASAFAFCIHKVWYSSNKHKRASTKRFWYSSHFSEQRWLTRAKALYNPSRTFASPMHKVWK